MLRTELHCHNVFSNGHVGDLEPPFDSNVTINEQLQNGYIKLYGDDTIQYGKHKEVNFFLKISGIWVSNQENELGLTFRFFIYNNLI